MKRVFADHSKGYFYAWYDNPTRPEASSQHELAKSQMKGFGGMVSFKGVEGNDALGQFLERLRICQLAVSLGGIKSLICAPSLTTHRRLTQSEMIKAGIMDNFIGLSVGIEDAQDLIDDPNQPLSSIS